MLEFRKVTKYYHSYRAIDFLNYNFSSSRIVVYGVEGSGTSTFLRLISGIEKPTKGEIVFNDKLIDIEKDTYFTFRNGGIENKTVRENLEYPLKIREEQDIESRVDNLLKEFDLESAQNIKLNKLPFEEKARLILAKIKLRKTNMLLIDNPFKDLDNELRHEYFERFLDLIKDYQGLVVYATDNKEEIKAFEEILILNFGFVKGVGKFDEIFSNPSNMFTYSLFNELKLFNGLLYKDKEDKLMFRLNDESVEIKDSIKSRILKEFVPIESILAVPKVEIEKIGLTVDEFSLDKVKDIENYWLFDWNENSLIK